MRGAHTVALGPPPREPPHRGCRKTEKPALAVALRRRRM